MQITTTNEINENLITVKIISTATGTTTIDAETEKNLLHNFPKEIEFSKIDFKGNMKLVNDVPIVTTDAVDPAANPQTVAEVEITDLINKKYVIDEGLDIELTIDVTKIPDAEVNAVFTTKEILGEAKAVLFATKVIDAITTKLAEIRSLQNTFEGETEVIL